MSGDDIRRGKRASLLLADPLLVECFERLDAQIRAAWLATAPGQVMERESYFYQTNALAAVRASLEMIAAHGAIAESDRDEAEAKRD
jgi:predicted DNA-binding protein with PD1-like motif